MARIMAEMPVSPAAFPQNRPPVRSSKKRGRDFGRNRRFPCRVSAKSATCAFYRETWPAKRGGVSMKELAEKGMREGIVQGAVLHGSMTASVQGPLDTPEAGLKGTR